MEAHYIKQVMLFVTGRIDAIPVPPHNISPERTGEIASWVLMCDDADKRSFKDAMAKSMDAKSASLDDLWSIPLPARARWFW